MSFATSLKQADIFYELTPTQLELVAALCQERRGQAGDVIFEENAASDELYIIAQGEVDIQVDPALVDQGLRSASARCAANNTQLLVIPRDKLILLCDTYPQLGYRLMRNLAADLALKIRSTDLRIREELLYGQRRR